MFETLVEKAKIVKKIKYVELENERKSKVLAKNDSSFTSSNVRPIKQIRKGKLQQKVVVINSRDEVYNFNYCGKRHTGECWKKLGTCFKCGSMEHMEKECPQQTNQT